jgi:hypothetical protein
MMRSAADYRRILRPKIGLHTASFTRKAGIRISQHATTASNLRYNLQEK